jgi:hypothetical protein
MFCSQTEADLDRQALAREQIDGRQSPELPVAGQPSAAVISEFECLRRTVCALLQARVSDSDGFTQPSSAQICNRSVYGSLPQ